MAGKYFIAQNVMQGGGTTPPIVNKGYGRLYNWYAATSPILTSSADWRVPTAADWDAMLAYGEIGSTNGVAWRLREPGLAHWSGTDSRIINDLFFSVRGSGYRVGYDGSGSGLAGTFKFLKSEGYFWSQTQSPIPANGTAYEFPYHCLFVQKTGWDKRSGNSIRLVRNSLTYNGDTTGTYVGNDGTVYNTVVINNLEWLTTNLIETQYRDHFPITQTINAVDWAAAAPSTGVKDWYLPSLDELGNILQNIGASKAGMTGTYWTSSNLTDTYANSQVYVLNVTTGTMAYALKSSSLKCRPIRNFNVVEGGTTRAYRIGDVGPMGGWIFSVRRNSQNTQTTYYEVGLVDLGPSKWSNVNAPPVLTMNEFGYGKQNTLNIMDQSGFSSGAAKLCADYSVPPVHGAGMWCYYNNDATNL